MPPKPDKHKDTVVRKETCEDSYQNVSEENSGSSIDIVSKNQEMDAQRVHSDLVKDVLYAYNPEVPLHFYQSVHQH